MIEISQTKLAKKPLYKNISFQVFIAIVLGVLIGSYFPEFGIKLKILGDIFIKLIKMIVGPIIFCTVVVGIASMESMATAGRIAVKTLTYFILLTFISLAIGLFVANVFKPGEGMNIDVKNLSDDNIKTYTSNNTTPKNIGDFLVHIIPQTPASAFTDGDIIQILFFAILFAFGTIAAGERAAPLVNIIDQVTHVLFEIIGFIMKIAPIAALGAIAFTVGQYGFAVLLPLGKLVFWFYISCASFILIILGLVMRYIGLNLFQYLRYIKQELLIILGTSSSETVLPSMLNKMTELGCERSVVRMVLPTGYSFNLDGTSIYLTLAAVFLAQATNTPLTLIEQITLLGIMLITSKGAAGVTGAGFIVLAASISAVGHIPVTSIALILGVDRFMSLGRALTNLIGNGVATLYIAKKENVLNLEHARNVLARKN